MEEDFRTAFEIYLIGAVLLFTIAVGGTFLISLFKHSVDLLIPLKALTLYTLFAFLLLDYLVGKYFEAKERAIYLSGLLLAEVAGAFYFVPDLLNFFGQTSFFSLGEYSFAFKLFPAIGLLFAITGCYVVVYYSVDIEVPKP